MSSNRLRVLLSVVFMVALCTGMVLLTLARTVLGSKERSVVTKLVSLDRVR